MIKTWAVMSFPARISISPTAYRGEGRGGGVGSICSFTSLTSPDIYAHVPKLRESLGGKSQEDLGCPRVAPCSLARWPGIG